MTVTHIVKGTAYGFLIISPLFCGRKISHNSDLGEKLVFFVEINKKILRLYRICKI